MVRGKRRNLMNKITTIVGLSLQYFFSRPSNNTYKINDDYILGCSSSLYIDGYGNHYDVV